MKSRIARLGVLIASIMGLLLTSTPAEATWVKNVTLVGNANLTDCPGLAYPGVNGVVPETNTTFKNGPKGEPEVNTEVRNGNTCDFSFLASCVKESIGKKLGVDTCVILAVGTLTGFCGLSSGTGRAALINTSNTLMQKPAVVTDFKFSETSAGVTISGGDATQNIHGVVQAMPDSVLGTGSCTNKTSTSINWFGDLIVKKITE